MPPQGAGRINLANSQAILKDYKPRASVVPASLDLTDCPFMWPYCKQPLYAYALPLAFNATLLNGMGVSGRVVEGPVFEPADEGGRLLQLTFEHSTLLWPWSGYLAIYLQVSPWTATVAICMFSCCMCLFNMKRVVALQDGHPGHRQCIALSLVPAAAVCWQCLAKLPVSILSFRDVLAYITNCLQPSCLPPGVTGWAHLQWHSHWHRQGDH